MKLIVCIDDKNGMMFNNRRQSKDSKLIDDVISYAGGKLWTNSFSIDLFDGHTNVKTDENFLMIANDDEYCFVENIDISKLSLNISEVVIYRWNRVYPADRYFDFNLSGYNCTSTKEFIGNSHEKITKEVYVK